MTRNYIENLYGRRQDKPLRARPKRLMDELLPEVSVPTFGETEKIDLHALFPGKDRVWLEIGFGGGEHLAWQAERHKDVAMIGAEPFINGVAKLLSQIEENKIENVRIHFGDARPLLEALPDQSIERLFVLHPDPWPKKRHFKRRMISAWFFTEAERLIQSGGELRVASDIPDYIRWTLMHARAAKGLEWTAERPQDWKLRPEDWPQTRYEAKAVRERREPCYLVFRRRAC